MRRWTFRVEDPMVTTVRRGTLVVLIALSVACDGIDPPMAPTATPPRPVSTLPPPPPAEYPPINGRASLFEFSGGLSYPVRGYATTSRYALDAGGAFALQYLGFEYVGSYQEEGATIRCSSPATRAGLPSARSTATCSRCATTTCSTATSRMPSMSGLVDASCVSVSIEPAGCSRSCPRAGADEVRSIETPWRLTTLVEIRRSKS